MLRYFMLRNSWGWEFPVPPASLQAKFGYASCLLLMDGPVGLVVNPPGRFFDWFVKVSIPQGDLLEIVPLIL